MSTNFETKLATIETTNLAAVCGGADRPGYTWGDFTRGLVGGGLGLLGGGPIGGVVGFGAGFMSRNVSELGNSVDQLSRERQRSQQLDRQRQQQRRR